MSESQKIIDPSIFLECGGMPEDTIGGIAKAYVCEHDEVVLLCCIVKKPLSGGTMDLSHGNYERQAGTVFWVPAKRQVAGPTREGWTLEDLVTQDVASSYGDDGDWIDLSKKKKKGKRKQ